MLSKILYPSIIPKRPKVPIEVALSFTQSGIVWLGRVIDPLALPDERVLFKFSENRDLAKWQCFQDVDVGGQSTISLATNPETPGTSLISGNFSTEIKAREAPEGEAPAHTIKRSGFVGITSKEGEADFSDLDEFNAFIFRVKGDGRQYIANLRTDNWITGGKSHDVWQAALYARSKDWQEVIVPFGDFVLTWRGKVVEDKHEINPDRILTMGISMAGGKQQLNPPGRYTLGLEWIKAKRIEGLWETQRNSEDF